MDEHADRTATDTDLRDRAFTWLEPGEHLAEITLLADLGGDAAEARRREHFASELFWQDDDGVVRCFDETDRAERNRLPRHMAVWALDGDQKALDRIEAGAGPVSLAVLISVATKLVFTELAPLEDKRLATWTAIHAEALAARVDRAPAAPWNAPLREGALWGACLHDADQAMHQALEIPSVTALDRLADSRPGHELPVMLDVVVRVVAAVVVATRGSDDQARTFLLAPAGES